MAEKTLTAYKWALVASVLTGKPDYVLYVALIGLFTVLMAAIAEDV